MQGNKGLKNIYSPTAFYERGVATSRPYRATLATITITVITHVMVRLFVILFDAHPCIYGSGLKCKLYSFRAANSDVEFEVIDVVGGGGGGGGPPGTIPPYHLFSTNN